MTSVWVQEAAERFWADAGGAPDAYPRDLRRAIALALPLGIVDLPRLRVADIARWLQLRSVALSFAGELAATDQDRRLRAGLLAYRDVGLIFLDGADPEEERRLSLAHEVAHFLVEYLLPREQAVRRLGDRALPVLDGLRPATLAERADAILGGVELRPRLHLLDRAAGKTWHAEQRADMLALELLAPVEVVRARLGSTISPADAEATLRTVFGLPPVAAQAYAQRLAPEPSPDDALLARLRRARVELGPAAGNKE